MPQRSARRLVKYYRLVMVVILLVAAVLRLYGLNNVSPPGIEHDEVAHWIINRDILNGNHGLYFAEAYGHEAGFHYVQTAFMAVMGDNALILRLPSAFAGLLLVAVSFALARRLFGLRTALLSAGLMAVLFWPVFYSRLALRAIALPLVSGLSAYFWWRGWSLVPGSKSSRLETDSNGGVQRRWFALAGLLAGLALYTYMASRVLPIFYGLFVIYLLIFHRSALRKRRLGVGVFFAVAVLVAAPLVIYLVSNSGVESRISEVDQPLRALVQGDLKPALENTIKIIAMFGLRGDPLWRQNVAYLPVFDVVIAALFTLGLVISLWRWRQERYMFVILWLITSAIPSIITIDAPSSIRIINALPVLGIFPVIGLEVIHFFNRLSTVSTRLSPVLKQNVAIICLLLLFVWHIGRTWRAVFYTWPTNDEVQFVWQQALTDAAGYLDQMADAQPVAIGGWTPDTMDPPTMELTLKRDDLSLRHFDPGRAVIVPVGGRLVYPSDLPLHPLLATMLAEHDVNAQPMGSFTVLDTDDSLAGWSDAAPLATFADEISLIGYDVSGNSDDIEVVLIWRVERLPADGRRVYLHLLDESGDIVAQDDAMGAPAAYWQPGDIIIQRHTIGQPDSAGRYSVLVGIYDPETGLRLLTEDGADSVAVESLTIE